MIGVVVAAMLAACAGPAADTSAASALNCMTMYPTPDLPGVTASISLQPVSSPFGVSVLVDGRPRYRLRATVAGLPAARTLGAYDHFVAWAYTVSLDSVVKLGPVTNGRVDLGELNYVQFRVLITAERGAGGLDRHGRLVLRGTSPSARLMAHRDLVQPQATSTSPPPASNARMADMSAMHDMRGMHDARDSAAMGDSSRPSALAWTMPPMSPRMQMMQGMQGLVPPVAPYLPSPLGRGEMAVGPAVIRARDGDTISLRAAPIIKTIGGHPVTMLGFNGRSPGPLLDIDQGATVTIRVINAIDASTSMHWHGVRLDNVFDGASGLTQPAIAVGGDFVYRVHVPDAGMYWYHPHVREDVQQSLGLFGNILVRPRDRKYFSPVDREVPLVLSDVLAGSDGLVPFGLESPSHALMGRFGNVFLVNGEEHHVVDVDRGDVVRFYVTNVSASRFYNFSLPGVRMKVVGADVGKFEHEEWANSVVIAPAERFIIEARFPTAGEVPLVNRVQALDHMIGTYTAETDTLAIVRVATAAKAPLPAHANVAASFAQRRTNTDVERDLAPFRTYFGKRPDRELTLTLRTHDLPGSIAVMLQGINAAVEWNDGMPMMNWVTTGREVKWVLRDPATGKENMDIGWRFHRGDVVKIRVFNDPSTGHAMAHPIHFHGQRFLVLARDGVKSENLAWKDTAIIPAGETVDLLVDMSNPGQWMLHCHIAEHLSAGMMSAFVVE